MPRRMVKRPKPLWQLAQPLSAMKHSPGKATLAFLPGEVSERLKEQHWKCCIRVTVSGVRIPPSPLASPEPNGPWGIFVEAANPPQDLALFVRRARAETSSRGNMRQSGRQVLWRGPDQCRFRRSVECRMLTYMLVRISPTPLASPEPNGPWGVVVESANFSRAWANFSSRVGAETPTGGPMRQRWRQLLWREPGQCRFSASQCRTPTTKLRTYLAPPGITGSSIVTLMIEPS